MTDSIAQYQTGGDLFGVMEQADSPVRVIVPTVTKEHQASIGTGTATAGTATLTGRPVGMDAFETIFYSGSPIVYNAATDPAQVTYTEMRARYVEFKWTLSGGNGTFLYSFAGLE